MLHSQTTCVCPLHTPKEPNFITDFDAKQRYVAVGKVLWIVRYITQSVDGHSCTRIDTLASIMVYLSVIPPAGATFYASLSEYVDLTEAWVAVFAGLRAYALTQRHWLSAVIFLLSSVQFIVDTVGCSNLYLIGLSSRGYFRCPCCYFLVRTFTSPGGVV